MSYSTEKNKIFKIWNDSIENQFQITNLFEENKIVLSKTNRLNSLDTTYNNIILLGSDWITPEFKTREPFSEAEFETVYQLFSQFTVEINEINKNIIPYIESKISYRMGNGQISLDIPELDDYPFDEVATLKINDIVEVNDTENDNIKNIIYRTSVFLEEGDGGLPENLELKFYINVVNPAYYQSS